MSRRRSRRARRKLPLLLLVAVVGGGERGVWKYFPEYLDYLPWRRKPAPEAAVVPDLPLAAPAAERLAQIEARLRLAPDQRAIASLGEIRRLARGKTAKADVRWV